jgi:hypothetical protein
VTVLEDVMVEADAGRTSIDPENLAQMTRKIFIKGANNCRAKSCLTCGYISSISNSTSRNGARGDNQRLLYPSKGISSQSSIAIVCKGSYDRVPILDAGERNGKVICFNAPGISFGKQLQASDRKNLPSISWHVVEVGRSWAGIP